MGTAAGGGALGFASDEPQPPCCPGDKAYLCDHTHDEALLLDVIRCHSVRILQNLA